MFAHIEGILSEKEKDSVVIDVHGVGYLLTVSTNTLSQVGKLGDKVKLYAYLSVREDAMELFGFYSRDEKRMFEKLKGVNGVGAKSALAILSAMTVQELSLALATGDVHALQRAPGIGRKTAERMLLELKDKVDNRDLVAAPNKRTSTGAAGSAVGDAIEALIALGYPAAEAAKAVTVASEQATATDEIIRIALKNMM